MSQIGTPSSTSRAQITAGRRSCSSKGFWQTRGRSNQFVTARRSSGLQAAGSRPGCSAAVLQLCDETTREDHVAMGIIRRSTQRFRDNPASIRNATIAIVAVTVAVVTIGAAVVRVFDRKEYPTFGKALWFTLQTVTTVGYGDATPERPIGRIVAAVVMVTAIGLITVVTASITSVFVDAAAARRTLSERADTDAIARLEASLAEIADRLDRLDSTLTSTRPDPSGSDDGRR